MANYEHSGKRKVVLEHLLNQSQPGERINLSKMRNVDIEQYVHKLQLQLLQLEKENEGLQKSQAELQQEMEHFSELYEKAPAGYATISEMGTVLRLNHTLAGYLGYDKTNLTGRFFTDLVHIKDVTEFTETINTLFENQKEQQLSIRMVRQNGTVFFAALNCKIMQSNTNEPVCAINVRDVTQDKKAENELKRQYEELEERLDQRTAELIESEATAKTLLDSPSDTLMQVSTDGRLLDVNEALAQQFGLTANAMIGKQLDEFLPAEAAQWRKKKIKEVIQSGKPLHFEDIYQGELRDTIISPVIDENKQITKVSIFTYNVTEQKRISQKIVQNLHNQELLSKISYLLLNINDFDKKINSVLYLLGRHTASSRVSVFQNFRTNKKTKNTYEWCRKNIPSKMHQMQDITYKSDIPSLLPLLMSDKVVYASQTSQLPADLHRFLEPYEVKSTLILPLVVQNRQYGFISLDDCEKHKNWNQQDIGFMKTASVIISNAFERLEADKSMRESEEKFRNVFNISSDAIFIVDYNLRFLEANHTAVNIFGYSKMELQRMKAKNIILHKYIDTIDEDSLPKLKGAIYDYAVSKDGKIIPAEIISKTVNYNGSDAIMIIVRDITTHSQSEGKIVRAVIEAEEKEKKRFAKDLHDGLGPLLSSLKLYLKVLSKNNKPEKTAQILSKTNEVIDEAIASIKEISNNISPHVLTNFGLSAAIKSFCNRINLTKTLEISFNTNLQNKRLENHIEVIIFRVVEELIHNTIKHASAKNIEINLSLTNDDKLALIYIDDGVGFDMENALNKQHTSMGLSNIFNRIESIRGKYKINTAKGKGLKVFIEVELKKARGIY